MGDATGERSGPAVVVGSVGPGHVQMALQALGQQRVRGGAGGPGAIVRGQKPECIEGQAAKLEGAEDLHGRTARVRGEDGLAGDAGEGFEGLGGRGSGGVLAEVKCCELVEGAFPAAADLGDDGVGRNGAGPSGRVEQGGKPLGMGGVGLLQAGGHGFLFCCAEMPQKLGGDDGPAQQREGVIERQFGAEQRRGAQLIGIEACRGVEFVWASQEGREQKVADALERQGSERPGK